MAYTCLLLDLTFILLSCTLHLRINILLKYVFCLYLIIISRIEDAYAMDGTKLNPFTKKHPDDHKSDTVKSVEKSVKKSVHFADSPPPDSPPPDRSLVEVRKFIPNEEDEEFYKYQYRSKSHIREQKLWLQFPGLWLSGREGFR